MSTELATTSTDSQVLPSLLMTFNDMEQMAKKLATSSLKELAGNEGNAFIMLMVVRDTGQSLLEVLNNYYLVDGKLAATAQYMLSQVMRAGHKVKFAEEGVLRNDDYRMTCTITRAGDDEPTLSVTWSIKRAKEAGLYDPGKKTSAWYKWTPAMLRWRAFTECARFAVPDSMGFVRYTPEELGAEVNEDGVPVITTAPAPQVTVTREDKPAAPAKPATVTKVTPATKSAPAPAAAAPAEAKKPTVIQGTAVEKPKTLGAQDIAAEAVRIVSEAVKNGTTKNPEVGNAYRALKAKAVGSVLMEKVTIPGENGSERTVPLRGALNVLEKHLA